MLKTFTVVDELKTDETGRVAITVQVMPPGAVVVVRWSPQGATANSMYTQWGHRFGEVMSAACAEAESYMRMHPEKRCLYRQKAPTRPLPTQPSPVIAPLAVVPATVVPPISRVP